VGALAGSGGRRRGLRQAAPSERLVDELRHRRGQIRLVGRRQRVEPRPGLRGDAEGRVGDFHGLTSYRKPKGVIESCGVTPERRTIGVMPALTRRERRELNMETARKVMEKGRTQSAGEIALLKYNAIKRAERSFVTKRSASREYVRTASSWQTSMFRQAMKNAKTRNIPWTLTWEEFSAVVRRANGRCEVSGIPFEFDQRAYGRRRPFIPSLDRKLSEWGYTKKNVRLVVAIVNQALSEWGDAPLLRLVKEMTEKAKEPQSRNLTLKEVGTLLGIPQVDVLSLMETLVQNEDYLIAPCGCLHFTSSGVSRLRPFATSDEVPHD